MGAELSASDNDNLATQVTRNDDGVSRLLRRLPWLDEGTAGLLVAIADDVANAHPEVHALILFGSVARHEERPITHRRPSDIDLLALVDAGAEGDSIPLSAMVALHHTIGEREYAHPVRALGVQTILAPVNLAEWDKLFISNIARDGVLLWARGSLPDALAPLATRGAVFMPDQTAPTT